MRNYFEFGKEAQKEMPFVGFFPMCSSESYFVHLSGAVRAISVECLIRLFVGKYFEFGPAEMF